MKFFSQLSSEGLEIFVDDYLGAAPVLSVEQTSTGHGYSEHFLEAEGLPAKLNFVGAMRFGLTSFVFDRNDATVVMKLDDITLPRHAQTHGANGETTGNAYSGPPLGGAVMGFLVENPALRGKPIFGPRLFEMDKRALPRAIEEMLKRGKGQEQRLVSYRDVDSLMASGRKRRARN